MREFLGALVGVGAVNLVDYCGVTPTASSPIVPDYAGANVRGIVPALLGPGDWSSSLPDWFPDAARGANQAVLLVLDGLGWDQLQERRHLVPTLAAMDAELRAACAEIADTIGLELDLEQIWHFPATPFEAGCVDAVREAAGRLGYAHRDIVSGAGHDAVYVAGVAPTGMIFVPCKDGISHAEIESATPEDLEAGCNVLLQAMLTLSRNS